MREETLRDVSLFRRRLSMIRDVTLPRKATAVYQSDVETTAAAGGKNNGKLLLAVL